MKAYPRTLVILLAAATFIAGCSSGDDSKVERRAGTAVVTGDEPGGSVEAGVLLVEFLAVPSSGEVGQDVSVTAAGYLDSGKSVPVTAGTQVAFSVQGNGTLSGSALVAADSSGKASTSIGASAPGAVTVEASINGVVASTIIQFAAAAGGGSGGNPGGNTDTLAVSSSVAFLPVNDGDPTNTSDQATITVTLTGSDVNNIPVKVSSTSGSVGSNLLTTDSAGVVTFTYTSGMLAEDVQVTISAAGLTTKLTIIVTPGVPATIEVGKPTRAVLGLRGSGSPESSVVTFTVKDRYGNLVDDSNVVTLALTPALTGAYVSPMTLSTNKGVVSPIVFSGTQVGTTRLVATTGGKTVTSAGISIVDEVEVPVVSSVSVSADKSTVSVFDSNPGNLGDQATITVAVRDQNGAAVSGVPVSLAASGGNLSSNSLISDVNGEVTVTFTSGFTARTAAVSAVADGVSGAVAISVSPAAPAYMSASAPSPSSVARSGSGSEQSSKVVFTLTDGYGNLVSDQTVVDFALSNALAGATLAPSSMNTTNGQVTVFFHPGTATGTTRIVASISGNPTTAYSADIAVTLGYIGSLTVVSDKTSIRVFDGDPVDGSDTATLVATVRNWAGSPMPDVLVQFARTSGDGYFASSGAICGEVFCTGKTNASGALTVTYTMGTSNVGATFQVDAVADDAATKQLAVGSYPGEPYAAYLENATPLTIGIQGSNLPQYTDVTAVLFDEYGNAVSQGVRVEFSLSPALAGATVSPAAYYTDRGGRVTTSVYSGTQAGTLQVVATIYGTTLTARSGFIEILGSSVKDVLVSSDKSSVSVYDDSAATGDQATITVNVRDQFGEAMAGVDVKLSATAGLLSSTLQTTDGSGNITVTFTAGVVAENVTVKAVVAGVQGTTVLSVSPGDAYSVVASAPSALELGLQGSGDTETSNVNFTVRDIYGNLVTDGTYVAFTLNPTLANASVTPTSMFTTNGKVSTTVRSGTVTGTLAVEATVTGSSNPSGKSTDILVTDTLAQVSTLSVAVSKSNVTVYDDDTANAGDQAAVVVTVRDQDGLAVTGVAVSLATSTGHLSQTLATSDGSGQVSLTFTAGMVAGQALISAEAGGVKGTASVTILPGEAYIIEMGNPNPAVVKLEGTGTPTNSIVPVTVKDKYGNLVSDGTVVNFSLVPALTGASVSPVTITTSAGTISPVVHSGTESGALRLMATAAGRSVISSEITIEGSPASQVSSISISSNKTSIRVDDNSAVNTSDEANLVITVRDLDGAVMSGVDVQLTSSAGTLSDSLVTTDGAGTAAVTYTAGIVAETVTISADANGVSGTLNLTVGPGDPFIITVGDPAPAQLGIKGSGSPESSVLAISITDQFGNAVSDSTTVAFKLEPSIGGAAVSPTTATTHDGLISAVVSAGTKSGTVRLVATVASYSVTSGKITIFGGVPSADRFSLVVEVGKRVMSGFGLSGLQAKMTVFMTDTFGNPAQPGTSIYVACEAGTCGSNNQTGIQSDENGVANFTFTTAFSNLIHIDPAWPTTSQNFGGFVGQNHTWPALGDSRKGKVRLIAVATGQSGYDDVNGNNVFDAGDIITADPSEPFLDINGSDTYEVGEDFWDYNGNGAWDDHAVDAFHSEQYVWSENEVIFATEPNLQMVPHQYIDFNGDGIFTWDVDLIAVGGPMTATTQLEFQAMFPAWAATNPNMTLQPGYASYVTTGTSISVSFADKNNNPLPVGSKMTLSSPSEGLVIEQPVSALLEYGADYFFPLAPVNFPIKDADIDVENYTDGSVTMCAEIDVSDSGKFGRCIPGQRF